MKAATLETHPTVGKVGNLFTIMVMASKNLGAEYHVVQQAYLGAIAAYYPLQTLDAFAGEGFRDLMGRAGGAVGVKEAGALYRPQDPVSREALRKAVGKRQMIGVQDGLGEWLFPVWQFDERGGLIPGMREVLDALFDGHPAYHDLTPVAFFLNAHHRLGNITPLEALRAGRIEEVKHLAIETHE